MRNDALQKTTKIKDIVTATEQSKAQGKPWNETQRTMFNVKWFNVLLESQEKKSNDKNISLIMSIPSPI